MIKLNSQMGQFFKSHIEVFLECNSEATSLLSILSLCFPQNFSVHQTSLLCWAHQNIHIL